jgi:hypothetical protein
VCGSSDSPVGLRKYAKWTCASLPHFYRSPRVNELPADGFGAFLGNSFHDGFRHTINKVLRFCEAKASDFVHNFDHRDLVRTSGAKDYGDLTLRRRYSLPAQFDLVSFHTDDFYLYPLALCEFIPNLFDELVFSHFTDVKQSFDVRKKLDERPKVDNPNYLPVVHLSHLDSGATHFHDVGRLNRRTAPVTRLDSIQA